MFQVLSDICYLKVGDKLQNIEDEKDVVPYMLNRWISMCNVGSALAVNTFNNKYWSVLSNKLDWYKFSLAVIPKSRFTKIEYIKKPASKTKDKKDKDELDIVVDLLSDRLEISPREVKSYITGYNIDISNIIKVFKNNK